jgi:anti-sigma factor RsiW
VSAGRCEEFRELVSEFVDERLEGAELLRLERHLESCPGCRAFEEQLRRFAEVLQAAEAFRPLRRPPAGFAAAVAARAFAEPSVRAVPFPGPAPTGRPLPWSWVSLAAAAVAALLFAWSWERLLPSDDPGQRLASRPPAIVTAAADEGSMDDWMRLHATVAREGTPLGSAEEVEIASFQAAVAAER